MHAYIGVLELTLNTDPNVAVYLWWHRYGHSIWRLDGRPRSIIRYFGVIVGFTVEDDDNYGNTSARISSQLAAVIDDAGIIELTAAKNANANTVTLIADVLVSDAKINSGSGYISHTIGDNATVKLALSAAA